jgi:hypothetical protein
MAFLELRNLTKRFGEFVAFVRELDVEMGQ